MDNKTCSCGDPNCYSAGLPVCTRLIIENVNGKMKNIFSAIRTAEARGKHEYTQKMFASSRMYLSAITAKLDIDMNVNVDGLPELKKSFEQIQQNIAEIEEFMNESSPIHRDNNSESM